MRTTITLDAHLLAKLKKRASESGTSVSRLIDRAVRLMMQAPPPAKRQDTFDLVTFGKGGRFSTRHIDKTSALVEAEDLERFGRGR